MPFLIYLLQVCLYSCVLWAIYCVVWRGKSIHRGSRAYLLMAALLPLLLPFIHVHTGNPVNAWMPNYQLPEFQVASGRVAMPHSPTSSWSIYYAYAFIATALACYYIAGYVRIMRTIATGNRQLINRNVVYLNTGIGPATIGRRIFFPEETYDSQILRHEEAHIRAGHRYDLLLMQVLTAAFWINPFAWILLRELKMVHEFEADAFATEGTELTVYTRLLLSETFGLRSVNTVHSFFHHPLKRRIIMLQHAKRSGRAFQSIAIALTLTAAFTATVLIAQTIKKHPQQKKAAKQSPSDSLAFIKMLEHAVDSFVKVNPPGANVVLPDGRTVYKIVDQMPAFNGDLGTYLGEHLHYPDSARARNQQGRSIIQFIVDENGRPTSPEVVISSGFPLLDKEAVRAVTAMPAWKPGMQKGTPVAVYFTLPITFKLD